MKKNMITVIIPVYNTEKYLYRSVKSVLEQTYKNFEIILINDGSTDSSGKICDELAGANPQIRVFHQENRGVSTARNVGLDNALGEFIIFADSDDELPFNAIELLIGVNDLDNFDLIIGNCEVIGNFKKHGYNLFDAPNKEFSSIDISHKILVDKKLFLLMSAAWGKLFRKEIIKNNSLRFDDSLINGEDLIFVAEYISCIHKIKNVDSVVYKLYRYDVSERISLTSVFYPDFFELHLRHSEILWKILEKSLFEDRYGTTPPKFLDVSVKFIDNLIANLVKAFAYEDFFKDKTIPLDEIVQNELVKKTIKVYKRRNKSYSLLIPLFIRLKTSYLLRQALKHRAKKYINSIGKSNIVKSIYRKIALEKELNT
jgi:glycosyltransferase involved in cell wall biosynthesis